MKRPLGFVALVYGAGLITGDLLGAPLWVLFTTSLATAATALAVRRARPTLLVLLVFLTGWTNLRHRTAIVSPFDLRAMLGAEAEQVIVRGRLADGPSERVRLRDDIETRRTLLEVDVTEICRAGEWKPAHGRVLATLPGTLEHLRHSGQRVEVSGMCAAPPGPTAWGLFDYAAYLRRQGIHFQLTTKPADWIPLDADIGPSLTDRFNAWARQTLSRGLPEIDRPAKLLWAMSLGARDILPPETYEPFIRSGTMHLFAISGLHMGLIATILVSVCRVARIPRHWCGTLVIPVLWFYTGATGWSASAVRASVMMSIVVGGWSLRRPIDLLNSLAAAALVILAWDPQQLFQAGFQLSFLVVLSLALLLPPFETLRDRLLQHDPMLPADLIPRWKRWTATPLRHTATAIITATAAWIGAWPITAYYFNLFSPVTILANLVMVPLGSAALACSLGSMATAPAAGFVSELFNHSAWFWMQLMSWLGELAAKVPLAALHMPAPGVLDLAIYYAALVAVLSGRALRAKSRRLTVILVALVASWYGVRMVQSQRSTVVSVVPCAGAIAVHVDAPGRRGDLLFDCGNPNSVKFVIEPFLKARGVNSLARFAISHGDARAMGGAAGLLERIPADRVIAANSRFRSSVYRVCIDQLESSGLAIDRAASGDQSGPWQVLHPGAGERAALADDACLVLKGAINGVRILLLSELGREGQERLLQSGADLRADVVIAGIPERSEPLRSGLLDAISPSLVIVTDAELPPSKRASPALRHRLMAAGAQVVFVRDAGAVRLTLRGGKWQCETMR